MTDLVFLPAHQLARMIRDRALSAVELLDAYLAQIAQHNPKLNAICTLNEENARVRAKQADQALAKGEIWGPLHGVPITIKDFFETQGLRTLARSVEDLRLCFALIAGADPRQPDVPPVPVDDPGDTSLKPLRIAWSDDFRIPVAAEIQTVLHEAVKQLTRSGATVEKWAPPGFDWLGAQKLYYEMAAYNFHCAQPTTLAAIRSSLTFLWREATQGEKSLRKLGNPTQVLQEILAPTLPGYFTALTKRDQITAQIDSALSPWDVWLTPVAATPAFTHRPAWSAIDIDGRSYPHALANGAYTMPFNLSGHPAVVIPIGRTQARLPIGLQIVGKRWREMELLAIAQALDSVVGDFRPPPGY